MTDRASVTTLSRLFLHTCRTYPKPELLKSKVDGRWQAVSTAEFEQKVRHLSLGLRAQGLKPGDNVALLAENGPDWLAADYAILCAGGITVPIFTSLPAPHIRYILDHSDARIVFSGGGTLWEKLAAVRPQLGNAAKVILLSGKAAEKALTMDEILAAGARAAAEDPNAFEAGALAVAPNDMASIIYTSGTTGQPKGVMLTHANFVSNVRSLDSVVDYDETDINLSLLPLSHVLERTGTFLFLYNGGSIVFCESVATVAEDLIDIRPTKMTGVPRLFEKMYARIMDQILTSSAPKRAIFFWAVRTGKLAAARLSSGRPLSKGLALRHRLARSLVFDKILERTGGRVRFFISGGAALAPDIVELFDAVGLTILPGYGLTETSPVLTGNTPRARRLGTVGKAIPGVSLRIADDGEILARGPNIMRGYYKDEKATREAMAGGWFHTGDIGRLDEDGFLTITDRKKDLIVTSGGKNVAPQPIESLILATPYIENIVVVGAERKFIAALVVPDFTRLEAYARSHGIAFRDRAELCRREEIVSLLEAEIDRATADLAPYEKIKKIAVLDRDFEIETGEITPTLKVRRNIVERKYGALIDSLYGD